MAVNECDCHYMVWTESWFPGGGELVRPVRPWPHQGLRLGKKWWQLTMPKHSKEQEVSFPMLNCIRHVYTRTLLKKTLSKLTAYLWKSYCFGCSFSLIQQNQQVSNLVATACSLKTAPHCACRFLCVNSKYGSKPARSIIGRWFFAFSCLNHTLWSQDYRCCRLTCIHLIRF